MVVVCSAFNCFNSSDNRKDLSFHKFPLKEKERLQKWVNAVGRTDFVPNSKSILCSLHFSETEFRTALTLDGKQLLKKCAIPTQFIYPGHSMTLTKNGKTLQQEGTIFVIHNNENKCETRRKFVDVGVQTELSGEELEKTFDIIRFYKRQNKTEQYKRKNKRKKISG